MRRLAAPLTALAALASPIALFAQDAPESDARESLQCAIWASYFAVEFQDQPEGVAFAHALNYFVGRYEGVTGHGIDSADDEDLVLEAAEDIDALTPMCADRMEAYGTRMGEWGQSLQAVGDDLPDEVGQAS